LNIRVVHPQHSHIGSPPGPTLGNFSKGMIIHAQETHRSGCLTSRGLYQASLGAQPAEGKSISTTCLLDESGIAQGGENSTCQLAHVVADGQDKTGSQLPQWCSGAGKRGGVGKEGL